MSERVKVAQSCPSLCDHGLYSTRNSPGQNTGVGSLSLLQGIFPTQGSNPGLPHYRWILYQLSHKEALKPHCNLIISTKTLGFLKVFVFQGSLPVPPSFHRLVQYLRAFGTSDKSRTIPSLTILQPFFSLVTSID